MDCTTFCQLMVELEKRYYEAEEWYKVIERFFGSADNIIKHNYFDIAIKAIGSSFDNYAGDDIEFLIFQCDFNFDVYCSNVSITDEDYFEYHPQIKNYEDYYYYLKNGPSLNIADCIV